MRFQIHNRQVETTTLKDGSERTKVTDGTGAIFDTKAEAERFIDDARPQFEGMGYTVGTHYAGCLALELHSADSKGRPVYIVSVFSVMRVEDIDPVDYEAEVLKAELEANGIF